MATLVRRWFDRLWHVKKPSEAIDAPLDCDACREARAEGRDACAVHHTRPLPHRYFVGDELRYSSGLEDPWTRTDDEHDR
jgi:hypothetical protein